MRSIPTIRVQLKGAAFKAKGTVNINEEDFNPKLHKRLDDPKPTAAVVEKEKVEMIEIVDPTNPDKPLKIAASSFTPKHKLWSESKAPKGKSQTPAK